MQQRKTASLHTVVLIGVLSALVFVLSLIQIPITLPFGEVTRIHLGNIMCILSGILFGPVVGGLSAGIGSMLYDFTNPLYISEFWLTFLMKFAMGFVAGLVAHRAAARLHTIPRALLAALTGQLLYTGLYLCRSAIVAHFVNGNPWPAVWGVLGVSALISLFSGGMTVLACTLIAPPLGAALNASGLFRPRPPRHAG